MLMSLFHPLTDIAMKTTSISLPHSLTHTNTHMQKLDLHLKLEDIQKCHICIHMHTHLHTHTHRHTHTHLHTHTHTHTHTALSFLPFNFSRAYAFPQRHA